MKLHMRIIYWVNKIRGNERDGMQHGYYRREPRVALPLH